MNQIDITGLHPSTISTVLGDITVDHQIAERARDFINKAVDVGYEGKVRSDFRTRADQEAEYRANPTGAAKPGHSPHEAGFALDFDWTHKNEKQRCALVKAGEEAGLSVWVEPRPVPMIHSWEPSE